MTDAPMPREEAERLLALCDRMAAADAAVDQEDDLAIAEPDWKMLRELMRKQSEVASEFNPAARTALPRALREVLRLQDKIDGLEPQLRIYAKLLAERRDDIQYLRRALDAAGIVLGSET